jgi:hypothetical protein
MQQQQQQQSSSSWLLLLAVTAVHAKIAFLLTLYPFVVPTNAFDGVYAAVAFGVVANWFLLGGDCALSVLEKRLFDDEEPYVAGSEPFRQWWMAYLDESSVASARIVFWCAAIASVAATVARNLAVRRDSLTLVLRFSRAARVVVRARVRVAEK